MIYAIFACVLLNASGSTGDCRAMPGLTFTDAAQCQAVMLKTFGPGIYNAGHLIPDSSRVGADRTTLSPQNWSGLWYECDGKPSWETAR